MVPAFGSIVRISRPGSDEPNRLVTEPRKPVLGVGISHNSRELLQLPEASVRPSGEYATALTMPFSPDNPLDLVSRVFESEPFSQSQSWIAGPPPAASVRPPGAKTTE